MHKNHVERMAFDGGMEQEHQIEIATSQITQVRAAPLSNALAVKLTSRRLHSPYAQEQSFSWFLLPPVTLFLDCAAPV
jgi:hypothetical protein